jgi:glutamine amidotransferase
MITIVDYGDACINEVAASISKITSDYKVSRNELDICGADKIIFAGCGNAPAVMRKIQMLNLYSILRVVRKPMLGIGLGMQLMADYSTEGNFSCLGFFPGTAIKFEGDVEGSLFKGYHKVSLCKQSVLFEGVEENAEFFFNNSYYLPKSDLSSSTCNNTIRFCSSVENENAYGVQFHPEMSGEAGLKLLKNFIEM